MRIQPCFIRKNTKELCIKLENLDLKLINSSDTTLDCHNYDGKGNHKNIKEGKAIITYSSDHYGIIYDIDNVTKRNRIDCGENEELFLAIAALRNDTDKNQWFTDVPGHWYKCTIDNGKLFIHLHPVLSSYNAHKATVKELIKHFSK